MSLWKLGKGRIDLFIYQIHGGFKIEIDCWNCIYIRRPKDGKRLCVRFPKIIDRTDNEVGCGDYKIDIEEVNREIMLYSLRLKKEIKEKNIKIRKLNKEKRKE